MTSFLPRLTVILSLTLVACSSSTNSNGLDASNATDAWSPGGAVGTGGATSGTGGGVGTGGVKATGGATSGTGGALGTGGARATGGALGGTGGGVGTGGAKATGGATSGTGGGVGTGGARATGGATSGTGGAKATGGVLGGTGGSVGTGGAKATGGVVGGTGGVVGTGGAKATGGTPSGTGGSVGTGGLTSAGGSTGGWPNIRVVGNHMADRWGKPFAVRSIESMFGSNSASNAKAFVAGHKALGANALGPLPNTSASSVADVEKLLAAAYEAGMVIGLNGDHSEKGEAFFQNTQLQAVINRYPNVFLQEAVELGSEMTASQWVAEAKSKVDAFVDLYPDKPLKIGSPMGGRSPRFALDHCKEVVDYYTSKGGRGGLIFTCQLYWKAATSSWSYQEDNGFSDGLPGILEAIDAMAASPCLFMPGLDNQDDVGYTGWREVMDHIRESNADQGMRTSFQWWVYYNSGDPYDNDLTTNSSDALSGITTIGRDVKAKLELDRQYVELGPLNP